MDQYDLVDARALGIRLVFPNAAHRKKPRLAVRQIVAKHKGLQQLASIYPWLPAFLEEAVGTDMHRTRAIKTKLENLSEKMARRIGKNLAPALRARKTVLAGVYQWMNQVRPASASAKEELAPGSKKNLLSRFPPPHRP